MVLILIVVDDGLVLAVSLPDSVELTVLILVVVDDGLVLPKRSADKETGECLNPCCSGRWSSTWKTGCKALPKTCLNPYCSGQ